MKALFVFALPLGIKEKKQAIRIQEAEDNA
jgi:hypothetical protein